MKIQLIRNATLKIWYGDSCFLVDPYFAPMHTQPSFGGKSANPLVDLPLPAEEILAGVDCVLVSHLHPDHFDDAARELLPKDSMMFCNPGDESALEASLRRQARELGTGACRLHIPKDGEEIQF